MPVQCPNILEYYSRTHAQYLADFGPLGFSRLFTSSICDVIKSWWQNILPGSGIMEFRDFGRCVVALSGQCGAGHGILTWEWSFRAQPFAARKIFQNILPQCSGKIFCWWVWPNVIGRVRSEAAECSEILCRLPNRPLAGHEEGL